MTTFTITRTFDAPRPLVFECWTQAEHLVRWFGPEGCKCEMLHSDIRPGGYNHASMTTPDGSKMYAKFVFREVSPVDRIVYIHSFADDKGNQILHEMAPDWPLELLTTIVFKDLNEQTEVTLTWIPNKATDQEDAVFAKNLDSCRGGWTGTFNVLGEYLKEI